MTRHNDWLRLTIEKPIEPELPICDSHHHLWRHNKKSLWRNTGNNYVAQDFLEDISDGHNVLLTVCVEAFPLYEILGPKEMTPVGETEFIVADTTRAESRTKIAAGIVGHADLTLGSEVAPVLEAQISSAEDRLRGIRFMTAWDETGVIKSPASFKDVMSTSKFREGFAVLQKYNLSFDAWLFFHQLSDVANLAKAFPESPIIVNHAGGILGTGTYAQRRDWVLQEWKKGITELAKCPNIFIKLGGLGMEACGFGWEKLPTSPSSAQLAKAMAPFYLYCVEKFGVQRCMFESNFPVDKESYSYTILWNAFKLITKGFSYEERQALFHDTAVKVYHL